MRTSWVSIGWVGIAILQGCGGIQTSELEAWINGLERGDGLVHISAAFWQTEDEEIYRGLFLEDDQVIASMGHSVNPMTQTVLTEDGFYTGPHYVADFSTGLEPMEIVVAIERESEEDAPRSVITFPPRFTLDPLPSSSSRRADLTVSWSPSRPSETISWQLWEPEEDGRRLYLDGSNVEDTGVLTIPAGRIQACRDTCRLLLSLFRVEEGLADPAFHSASARGVQERSAMFLSTP